MGKQTGGAKRRRRKWRWGAKRRRNKRPIKWINELPNGPAHYLPGLVKSPAPEHQLRIGKADYNDIQVLGNEHIEDTHCLLLWTGDSLEVRDYASDGVTLFGGQVEVIDGHAQLRPGDVLTLGGEEKDQQTLLHICGESPDELPLIPVRDIPDLVVESPEYHGSGRQAAKAIGMSQSTFSRDYAMLTTAVGVCVGLVAGGWWFGASRSDRSSEAPAQPAAAVETVPTPTPPLVAPDADQASEPPGEPEAAAAPEDASGEGEREQASKRRRDRVKKQPRARRVKRPTGESAVESPNEKPPDTRIPAAVEPKTEFESKPDWVMSSFHVEEWPPPHRVKRVDATTEGASPQ